MHLTFLSKQVNLVLKWAKSQYGDDGLFMSTAFGPNGVVLLDHVKDIMPKLPIFFIDTGRHFKETLELRDRYIAKGFNIISNEPREEVDLLNSSADECCDNRKVRPFTTMLLANDGRTWITALSRYQSPERAEIKFLQHAQWNKVNPMLAWNETDVWDYIREHKLDYNPLHDEGYRSIGCKPCTTKTKPGEPVRAGRWRGLEKTECGIHAPPSPEEPCPTSVEESPSL